MVDTPCGKIGMIPHEVIIAKRSEGGFSLDAIIGPKGTV